MIESVSEWVRGLEGMRRKENGVQFLLLLLCVCRMFSMALR